MTRLLAIRDLNQGDPLPLPGKKIEPPPAEPQRKHPEPVNGNPDILRGPDGKLYTDIDKNKGVRLRHSEVGAVVTPVGANKLESYFDDLRKRMPGASPIMQDDLSHMLKNCDYSNLEQRVAATQQLAVGDKVYVRAFGSGTVIAVVQDSVCVKLLDGSKVYTRAGDIQLSARPADARPKFRSGDRVLIWDEGCMYHKKFATVHGEEHNGLAQVTVRDATGSDTFTIRTEFLRHA